MSGSKAGIRYAKAVLQHAVDSNNEHIVFEDMQSVQSTLAGSKELRTILKSPVIKAVDKKEALLTIFSETSEIVKSLIEILVDNKRVSSLDAVAESFIYLYNNSKGVKVAKVTTAVPLSEALEKQVLIKVKEMTGSANVSIENSIDESIIGGFMLRVGDLQYNASIANQLGNLKREFSKSI